MFQASTILDLLAEFWEDQYYLHPLEAYRNADGEVQFVDTGDKLIDKWEKELAEGKTPDFSEAFTPEQLAKLDRLRSSGTDRFGKPIPLSQPTFKDAAESAVVDALRQGLGPKASPIPFDHYKRFSDEDLPE